MQTKITCSCGNGYWPAQKWMHEGCATNRLATNGTATNNDPKLEGDPVGASSGDAARDAGGNEPSGVQGDVGRTAVGGGAAVDRQRFPGERTANRRSKEAYNAYQREYMRKRRSKAA
jgi:hypothetical protein